MCNQKVLFSCYQTLKAPLNVVLGDDRTIGKGSAKLRTKLPNGKMNLCTLHDVLLVPDLAYNLFSVTSASKTQMESPTFGLSGTEKEVCTT